MTESLRHRGPDEGGIYYNGKIGLGQRRLSILDLARGKQPMIDPETGAVLIYNGEIYNHLEIRAELAKSGYRFRTAHSDTETVLAAFLRFGADCLLRFNGMFAFALYMPHTGQIWLCRDRFGEKPLFYTLNERGFAFASEICALQLWPGFDPEYNPSEIQRFFAWNYLPASRCIHKNCHSLPPGSWLCFNVETRELKQGEYWRFELHPEESLNDEEELAEELRRLIAQAVARRMQSDVPLGIFLSGGIDSSAVLAAATRVSDPASLDTFTIGFHEKSFDESQKAAIVASYLNVKNQRRYLTEADMQASIAGVLAKMSEPFGDASLIPAWQLCAFARESVKIALTGDGGDELFGGYDPLAAIRPAAWYRKLIPAWLHAVARKASGALPTSDKNMSLDFKIRRFLRGLSYPRNLELPIWMSGLEPSEIRRFFDHPLDVAQLYEDVIRIFATCPDYDSLEKALLFFTRFYLTDDILVKSDRASMMCSLETRAVFLDNDIVDFCIRLPMRFKYRNGKRKYLLRKALGGWLPERLIDQRKKGFGIPLNRWLKNLPQVSLSLPGLKPGALASCAASQRQNRGDYRFFLWDAQAFAALPGN